MSILLCKKCNNKVEYNWGNNKAPVCHLCARTMNEDAWERLLDTPTDETQSPTDTAYILTTDKGGKELPDMARIDTKISTKDLMVIISALAEYKEKYDSEIALVLTRYFLDLLKLQGEEK